VFPGLLAVTLSSMKRRQRHYTTYVVTVRSVKSAAFDDEDELFRKIHKFRQFSQEC
jgi:hypothetical protein